MEDDKKSKKKARWSLLESSTFQGRPPRLFRYLAKRVLTQEKCDRMFGTMGSIREASGVNIAEVGEGESEAMFTRLEMLEVMGVGKRKKYYPVAIW